MNNIFIFDLHSVGHELKIEIVSYPLIGEDVVLVGDINIRMESLGFFKKPNKLQEHKIKLRYLNPETKKMDEAGFLIVQTKFIYDIVKLRK